MKDITGIDMQYGDFIIYTDGGVNAPDLKFGWVRRLNEKTGKIWVEHANWDRTQQMKTKYDHSRGGWYETDEPKGVSIVNHTQEARFMIMP